MRISHDYKFVFLSMPKAASTTVREALNPYSNVTSVHFTETSPEHPFYHHMPAVEVHREFESRGWDWDTYTSFCVVRNPFDRMVSLYHHVVWMRRQNAGKLQRLMNLLRPLRFRDFIYTLDTTSPLPTSLRNFTYDESGRCLVDEVIMFERLDEELKRVLRTLGISQNHVPGRLNATKKRYPYREGYYDGHTRRRVAALYQEEIERFGYEF